MTSAGTLASTDGSLDASDNTSVGTLFACPGARWYEGDLDIDDATDLDALRDIGGVRGSLLIIETSSIVDLEFLSCLEIVEGKIRILLNDGLVDLHGLERLRVVDGSVDWVGPDLADLLIAENPALARIDGFEALEFIKGLEIDSNETLTEIEMPALVEVERLSLGGYCELGSYQPLSNVGIYPSLQHVGFFQLSEQYMFTSLDSLVELAEEGVTFGGASFRHNYALPLSEIEAFAAAAAIVPETCSNGGDTEICRQCPTD